MTQNLFDNEFKEPILVLIPFLVILSAETAVGLLYIILKRQGWISRRIRWLFITFTMLVVCMAVPPTAYLAYVGHRLSSEWSSRRGDEPYFELSSLPSSTAALVASFMHPCELSRYSQIQRRTPMPWYHLYGVTHCAMVKLFLPKNEVYDFLVNHYSWVADDYGTNLIGIVKASQYYFGKQPAELGLKEAAALMAFIRGPKFYSPTTHADRLNAFIQTSLERALEKGIITQPQLNAALATPLKLKSH